MHGIKEMKLIEVETHKEAEEKKEKFLRLLEETQLPKIKGALVNYDDGNNVTGCCAYGLGLIDYGMTRENYEDDNGFESPFGLHFHKDIEYDGQNFCHITQLNDRTNLTFPEIAKVLRDNFSKWHIKTRKHW